MQVLRNGQPHRNDMTRVNLQPYRLAPDIGILFTFPSFELGIFNALLRMFHSKSTW